MGNTPECGSYVDGVRVQCFGGKDDKYPTTVMGGGDDIVRGLGGNDWISDHLGGENIIYGDDGNDNLSVRKKDGKKNELWGGAGDDYLWSETNGPTFFNGGAGNDEADGGDGDDFLYGIDWVHALFNPFEESVPYKDRSSDTLKGGKGNDYLDGQGGADVLIDEGGDKTTFVDWDGGDTWYTNQTGAGVNTFIFHGPFASEVVGGKFRRLIYVPGNNSYLGDKYSFGPSR